MLLVNSSRAVKIPEHRTPQSPVCPRIVEMFIAKKNPIRIEVKFIIRESTMGIFFLIDL